MALREWFAHRSFAPRSDAMRNFTIMTTVAATACAIAVMAACGGGADSDVAPVTITPAGPNVVSQWNEIATTTINLPAATTGTPEEQRPNYAVDLATVQIAVYDAVIAIAGGHRPFAVTPSVATDDASQEAAAATAAYRVLLGLFPSRSASYQGAYDGYLASLPAGDATDRGVAIGAEVAAGVLALRANDGRSVALAPYVPGTAPGQFRGSNPVGRPNPFIKPYSVTSHAQFRAPGPPALTSAAYAADLAETAALGSATSTTRTAEQTEVARFNTEPPFNFWPRNLRIFATTNRPIAEQARLMAMIWVTHADTTNTCFESKYQFNFWRPTSAIPLADTDGNDATVADPAWAPVVATPNHPEYPAAHGCVAGAMAQVLRSYYRTPQVTFDFNSTVTGTARHFTSTDALVSELQTARVAGGMHFRTSTIDGAALGKNVADWVTQHHFQPR
jgi:PAP2 superfamily